MLISTRGEGIDSHPSEVAIGLSPYAFPQEECFHVPEESHFALTGVELAAPLRLGLLKALRREGLFSHTWRCASSPSDKISLGHQQSLQPVTGCISQSRARKVLLTKAKGRATLKTCQQSPGNYKSNFPGIVQTKQGHETFPKRILSWLEGSAFGYCPSLPPWWGLPRANTVTSLPVWVARLFPIYLKPSFSIGKETQA